MPPSPFRPIAYSSSPAATVQEDPLQSTPSPLLSPPVTYYTAPSTPLAETPKEHKPSTPNSPPPLPILHIAIPPQSQPSLPQYPFGNVSSPNAFPSLPQSQPQEPIPTPSIASIAQETFPDPPELPVDMVFDDEGLSTLEKIYLYSRSKASYHRVFIANVLPEWLEHVTPHDAVEYVLPLLNTLAMDEGARMFDHYFYSVSLALKDELVKEAFSSKLVAIMWWFLTHCQLIPEQSMNQDDMNPPDFHDHESPPIISVQEFTPILGTLLLSPNSIVGGAARYAVVQLLERIRRVDGMESKMASVSAVDHSPSSFSSPGHNAMDIDPEDELYVGLFGRVERSLFEKEILYQVVIGMGRLDAESDANANDDTDASPFYDDALEFQHTDHTVGYASPGSQGNLVVQVAESPEKYGDSQSGELQITNQHRAHPEDDKTRKLDGSINPYFPVSPSGYPDKANDLGIDQGGSPASIDSSESAGSTPGSTTGTSASSLDEESFSPPSQFSPRIVISPSSSNASPSSSQSSLPTYVERHTSKPGPGPAFPNEPSSVGQNNITQDVGVPSSSTFSQFQSSSPYSLSDSNDDRMDVVEYMEEVDENDHAAVGRLSSMSLMAAVAASGCLDDATKYAFVKEVERVSQDSIYWVRREACFAVGALAKVVPEELVYLTLMPLLSAAVSDPIHHVRHSSLYALPAILTRLNPKKRRELALDILVPMSMDESQEVRSGVLETLGEVIYTFHTDHQTLSDPDQHDDVPPKQLLRMFLGRTEDRRILDCHQEQGQSPLEREWVNGDPTKAGALHEFYQDPSRPLVCAFNMPAVALTLGRARWASDLREAYMSLTESEIFGVHRTLAASLGQLAQIIGPESARKDLMNVWRNCARNEEAEVRMKTAEALELFFGALDKAGQRELLFDLLVLWERGLLKGWREREKVAGVMGRMGELAQGQDLWILIARLEVLTLLDPVNAVREAGISALPILWLKFYRSNEAFGLLRTELHSLATSDLSRKRMTFIACLQALDQPTSDGIVAMTVEDEACPPVDALAQDPILGVRIGLARLICTIYARNSDNGLPIPESVLRVLRILKADKCNEVKAFVADLHDEFEGAPRRADLLRPSLAMPLTRRRSSSVTVSTFSRPPPFSKAAVSQPKIAVGVEA
ncbi:hypothetical protein VNI00_008199 [Paramarasmius palmivorus]|uniref:ARM repeat-containing protein n=1 Tax=Paramarasmius palmivorus TaxID=297713 RepID=A0AAW0CYF6_9AGAR